LDAGRLGEIKLSELTEKSYNAMTSNGDVELSYHIYKLSFLNFLLGKQPNDQGHFMFGWVEVGDSEDLFPIATLGEEVKEEEEKEWDNVSEEIIDETGSRKSVFV
jgi:hypothetical protein